MKNVFFVSTFHFILFSTCLWAQAPFEFLVSNTNTNSVKRYASDGTYLGNFVASNSGGLSGTQDMLMHPDGRLLVTGINNTTVKSYNGTTGAYLGDFSSGVSIQGPTKLTLGPDSLIYVTQWNSSQNEVVRLNLDGSFHSKWTSGGPTRALGQEWDKDGNLYVAIFGNTGDGVVRKFDPFGNDLGDFIPTTQLQGPTEIWFDSNGDLLVQDWSASNVKRFDSAGNFINVFTSGVGQSEGFAVFDDRSILMPDWASDVVHHVDSVGTYLSIFAAGNGLSDPNGILRRSAVISSLSTDLEGDLNMMVYPTQPSVNKTIEFDIDMASDIEVTAMDLKGRSYLIIKGNYSAGRHVLDLSTSELPSGLYLIRLKAGRNIESQKILIGD